MSEPISVYAPLGNGIISKPFHVGLVSPAAGGPSAIYIDGVSRTAQGDGGICDTTKNSQIDTVCFGLRGDGFESGGALFLC